LDEKELEAPLKLKKPSRIFVGSMIDMYHPDIKPAWMQKIVSVSTYAEQHTYITLTKFPDNLDYIFPPHWWVGITLTSGIWPGFKAQHIALRFNEKILGKRFISFEPLLTTMEIVSIMDFDWIIIGGLTPKPVHKQEWIDDIVQRANYLNIPVFIKPNAHYPIEKREFPNESAVKP